MAANAVYSDAMLKNMTDIQTDLDELKLNIDNMFLIINGIIVSRKCLYMNVNTGQKKKKMFDKEEDAKRILNHIIKK